MTATLTSKFQRRLIDGLLCGVVLMACAGCQTFSLTEEDFQRQQRGETVDRETGAVVGTVGSVGFLGALLGLAVAEAARK
jgi:nitrate/nitrite transporter NarK